MCFIYLKPWLHYFVPPNRIKLISFYIIPSGMNHYHNIVFLNVSSKDYINGVNTHTFQKMIIVHATLNNLTIKMNKFLLMCIKLAWQSIL